MQEVTSRPGRPLARLWVEALDRAPAYREETWSAGKVKQDLCMAGVSEEVTMETSCT